MTEKELKFRQERLVELQDDIGFFEEQIERLKDDIASEKTFKDDKRYVNFMSVMTNLKNILANYKSQEFNAKKEIEEELAKDDNNQDKEGE
jgi:hypothetical protein